MGMMLGGAMMVGAFMVPGGAASALAGEGPKEPVAAPARAAPGALSAGCVETPELQNLILPDGSLADVKILQFGEARLYMPTRWIEMRLDPRWGSPDMFIPAFWEKPCPGVVHFYNPDFKTQDGKPGAGPFTLFADRNEDAFPAPSLRQSPDTDMVFILPNLSTPSVRLKRHYISYDRLLKLNVVPGLIVYVFGNTPLSSPLPYGNFPKGTRAPAIEDLIRWLARPPNRRDNKRSFILTVDKP
jgi:hypothetical protein